MHIDIFVCIPVVIFIITLIDNDPLTSDINKIYILKNLFVYIYSARLIVLLYPESKVRNNLHKIISLS